MTRLAIDRNRVTLILVAVLIFSGLQSYRNLPQAEDPGFTIRVALVQTRFPGASPERVEQLVTDKLEKAIQELPELDSVTSQSKTGLSLITVNIQERYSDMRPIFDKLRRKVERVADDLPDGVHTPIVDDEFGDVFGTMINLTGDGYGAAELEQIAEEVRDELLLLDDVAKVDLYGVQEERIFVEYSNARLAELGLAPQQLRSVLGSRNILDSGGSVRTDQETIVIEPTGNFESVEQIGRTLVPLPNGALIRLSDVARIERAYDDPPRTRMRASGVPGLCLAVAMREGGNIVELGGRIRETIERLRTVYPHGVELDFVQVQGDVVERKVSDFLSNLVQAIVIVMVVMLLSLGLRTGLVVASLIPTAIVMAFLFMPLVGVGIDQMSLAALIIALGLLVDNAIVVSESILVQMGEGKSPRRAAIDSAGELRIPLLVSSLTTAAAFLPIFLAESAVGEYTGALFKVVTITLLCSWVLALTLIPLLAVFFLRVKKKTGAAGFDSRFYRSYRRGLLMLLRRPLLAVAGVVVVFCVSLWLFRFVEVIFFPANDRPTLTAELTLPTGTPLAATERVVDEFESYIRSELLVPAGGDDEAEGVTNWATFVGEGGPRFYLSFDPEQSSSEYAMLLINTTSRAFVDQVVERLTEFGRQFPGLETSIEPMGSGPPAGSPIEVRLSGRDGDRLFDLVDKVKAQLDSLEGPIDVIDDWGARSKKLIVEVDDDRAQRAGVTHQDVAQSLRTLFSGLDATEYREGDKIIPVTLRSERGRAEPDSVASLNAFSPATGNSVPLTQVAHVEVAWEPGNIRRRNRLKSVAIQADLAPGYSVAKTVPQLEAWLQEESASWPLGYSWEIGGEDEASAEANASIGAQLPTAGLLIVLLLVAQFNSLRKPAIILLTIPLGLIGVVIGLLVLPGVSFGFMTLLGVISLAGIVINNAIVLLDRIQLEIDQNGLTPQRAIVESAQRRLRPIMLTTFTTLGGMIPLYLGGGPLFESLAAAIMFGLVFATALTLGVVPVLYALFYRVSFREFSY